jgi:flap endonuclease-1
MGIKNLLKFLYNFSNIIKIKHISDFYNKRIAIDISILLYQSVISIRNSGHDIVNNDNMVISHIIGLLNKILNLLESGIIPVFVFDGKPPIIKNKLLAQRKEIKLKAMEKYKSTDNMEDKIKFFKRCVSITKEQMDDCRELLTAMGLPYINATEEADSVLADLCKNNMVHAVLTEDMDILTFGAPRIIRNVMSLNKPIIEINLNDILTTLNITHNEFIELCIYFGCDYCALQNEKKLNNLEIYDIYKTNKIVLDNFIVVNKDEYKTAKKYFTTNYENNVEYTIDIMYPDVEKLTMLLKTKYNFPNNKIKYKINRLLYYYNKFHFPII